MNNDKKISIGVNLDLHTIQAIRLVGALLETDFLLYLPENSEEILKHLKTFFNIDYRIGINNILIISNITIDHQTPYCKIGEIKKSLIFPFGVIERCKRKWMIKRRYDFLFSGLMTKKRLVVIKKWIKTHSDNNDLKVFLDFFIINLFNSLVIQSSLVKSIKYSIIGKDKSNTILTMSTLGRTFPQKAWDDNYYDLMANSKFVLCPDGDFIWTYRFFEAMLCGAIPIIENKASIYNGFHYYKITDPSEKYIYNADIVRENFMRTLDFLTVSKGIIYQEIMKSL